MTATPQIAATLDHNGQIPVMVNERGLSIHLDALEKPGDFGGDHGHLQQGLKLYQDGKLLYITPHYDTVAKTVNFHGDFLKKGTVLQLRLYDQPVLTLRYSAEGMAVMKGHEYERLTIDDMRMLATSQTQQENVPMNRALFAGFDPKKHAPITDLHTHSSAQLSNEQLIGLALKHGLSYPVELLKKLNIRLSNEEASAIQSHGLGASFQPTEHEKPRLHCETQNEACDVIPLSALTPEHLQRLQDQLRIPQDMTLSFTDFDKEYYRFVNPLVKNPVLTKDLILTIARDYAKHGIKYAELSTGAMLNLDKQGQATWFKEMIETVKEAEAETGVQLRFLIGIPRSYGPAKVIAELQKIKYAARHPLIAGIDLLGYESDRTSKFSAALSHIADWARAPEGTELSVEQGWDFKRDFTIRIHAGETGKNSGNVAEAVDIAERYGVHVRIAHAINEALDPELDAKIRKLSSQEPPLVSMEFCPSSNLAYNNIQHVSEVPLPRWLKCCKSWFLGTDGAGAIQTTPVQLSLAALGAGATLDQLAELHANEKKFIARAQKNFDLKTAAYRSLYGKEADAEFLKGFAAHAKEINDLIDPKTLDPVHPKLPKIFEGKRPILVAGASQESFDDIQRKTQSEIVRAMRMLVAATDPKKTYFVVGRSKSEGLTAALDQAIVEHNEANPTNKFAVLALITEDISDLPRSISWVVPQPGRHDSVPENIVNFMRGTLGSIPGISIFIGGSNYTSDMILKTRQGSGMAFLLMENVKGASHSHAKKLGASYHFNNGDSLLNRIGRLFSTSGPLAGEELPFREGINVEDQATLDRLSHAANDSQHQRFKFSPPTGRAK
jgi:adenosine deaminase